MRSGSAKRKAVGTRRNTSLRETRATHSHEDVPRKEVLRVPACTALGFNQCCTGHKRQCFNSANRWFLFRRLREVGTFHLKLATLHRSAESRVHAWVAVARSRQWLHQVPRLPRLFALPFCARIFPHWTMSVSVSKQTGHKLRCGRCTGAERLIPGTLCASVVGRSCNNRNVKRNACSDGGLQSVVGVCKASRQLERRSATDASFYWMVLASRALESRPV